MGRKPNSDQLSFFKIMIGDFHSQMYIPPRFIKLFGKIQSKEYVLESRRISTYVSATKMDDAWYFKDGWESFIKHNSISLGDFLLFEYAGGSKFYVTIYGRNCCEKELTATTKIYRTRCPEGKFKRTTRKDKARVAATNFTSKHPFFQRVLTEAYVNRGYLSIPPPFFREYMKGTPDDANVTLWVSNKAWSVRMKIVKDRGTGRLSAGMVSFVRENGFNVGDVCVFEVLQTKNLVLRVTRLN